MLVSSTFGSALDVLTEKVIGLKVLDECHADQDSSTSHASHAQDGNRSQFGLPVHVEVPEQENRQDAKREVADGADGAVEIREAHDDVDIDAFALCSGHDLVPEIVDGSALEDGDEEEDDAGEDGEAHDGVDDPVVHLLHRQTEKHDADGDFGGNHGQAVGNIAQPPVL